MPPSVPLQSHPGTTRLVVGRRVRAVNRSTTHHCVSLLRRIRSTTQRSNIYRNHRTLDDNYYKRQSSLDCRWSPGVLSWWGNHGRNHIWTVSRIQSLHSWSTGTRPPPNQYRWLSSTTTTTTENNDNGSLNGKFAKDEASSSSLRESTATPLSQDGTITSSSSSSSLEPHSNDDEYMTDWFQRTRRLLANPEFSDDSWRRAHALLNVIRRDKVGEDEPGLVCLFDILNCLCRQLEAHHAPKTMTTTSSSAKQEDEEDYYADMYRPRIPFQQRILEDILGKWRSYMYSITPLHTTSTTSFLLKQRWNQVHPAPTDPRLGPAAVLGCVQDCFKNGLFLPSSGCYDVILAVLARTSATSSKQKAAAAAHEAHQLYQSMVTAARGKNPNEHGPLMSGLHPTAQTIQHLVEIWSKSKLPEASDRVEDYLRQLQQWYEEKRTHEYWPTSFLYCAMMETHSQSTQYRRAFGRIQELLEEMMDNCDASELDSKALTRVCRAFANCQHPHAPDAARRILDDMLRPNQPANGKPTQHTFSTVMTAYGRAGRVEEAEALLTVMEDLSKSTGDPNLRPNAICFNALIWACARAGDASRAEAILPRMAAAIDTIGTDGSGNELLLYQETLTGVLTSWARSGKPDAARRVAEIIQQLEKYLKEQQRDMDNPAFAGIYNTLLTCYSQQENPILGIRLASDLIQWMEEQDNTNAKPNGQSYLNMMSVCWNAKQPEDCEKWLRRLIDKVREGEMSSEVLTTQQFNVAIAAWSSSKSKKAAKKATALFELAKQSKIAPDIITYNSLLTALANSVEQDTDQQMEGILDEMLRQSREGNSSVEPDQHTYNCFLSRLSTNRRTNLKDVIVAKRSASIFEQMRDRGVPPNNVNYNTAMKLWSRRMRPDRVEGLFQEMKHGYDLGDENLKPHYEAFITRLQAWSAAGNPQMTAMALRELAAASEEGLFVDSRRPGTREFNALIQAWLRSNLPEASASIEKMLQEMTFYSSNGRTDCQPDVYSYTAAISSYNKLLSNAPNQSAAQRIWELYLELKRLAEKYPEKAAYQPNDVTYSAVLEGLLRSKDDKAALCANLLEKELKENPDVDQNRYKLLIGVWSRVGRPGKVEDLFQEMKKLSEEGRNDLAPDLDIHSIRLEAWSKAGSPGMTTKVLGEMIQSEHLNGKARRQDFNSVLLAWKRSNRADAAEKAEETLRTMSKYATEKGCDCLPDAFSFSTVIAAYVQSRSSMAGKKAFELLNELKCLASQKSSDKYLQPMFETYAQVIVGLTRSRDPLSETAVVQLMEEMQAKPREFWNKESYRSGHMNMTKIREALSTCSYPSKSRLLVAFSQLESALTGRKKTRKH